MAKKLKLVTLADGRRVSIRQAVEETGLPKSTIQYRISQGWRGKRVTETNYSISNRQPRGSKARNYVHGQSHEPIYRIWAIMRRRCENPNSDKYRYYGKVGIKVCRRWSSFLNFYEDMGQRPKGKRLLRKNEKGDFTPSNCYWGVPRPRGRKLTYKGESLTIREWSKKLGLTWGCINQRLQAGKSVEEALFV